MPNEPCFTPEDFLRWTEKGGILSPKVHNTCVLAMVGYEQLCEGLGAEPVEERYWKTFLSKSEHATVANPGMGAPLVVMRAEEIIALGGSRLIFIGSAGGLCEDVPIGSIIIPTSAIVDEGTSRHYVGARERIDSQGSASEMLSEAAAKEGVDIIEGAVWTIDAPYREMKSRAEELSGQGVVAVEMECSALFALGEFRKVEVGGVVVMSDALFPEWRFDSDAFEAGMQKARKIIVRVARELATD